MSPIPDAVQLSSPVAVTTTKTSPGPSDVSEETEDRPRRPPAYRMWARWSAGVVGLYFVLAGALTYLGSERLINPLVAEVLVAALIIYLGRYLSTRYRLTHRTFMALRMFGSRRIPLEEIRHASHTNLRDLAPVSFIGSWGWRGRMWSPRLGQFDTVHTTSEGLLISGGTGVPVFISPKDPEAFLAELSRRVRSYNPDIDIETTAE